MEATQFPFSVITASGQRYHPAIVAQAIATLLQMYPNRLSVSLGSGEAFIDYISAGKILSAEINLMEVDPMKISSTNYFL